MLLSSTLIRVHWMSTGGLGYCLITNSAYLLMIAAYVLPICASQAAE
ncbi:unnamed protein product [Linum tenue]|uniref:Uncharacterized protein n=1 Tax=Linum tenue TaxID=586396 RepID=A0AAV0KSV7_9ROSI|nr:unnamed protein product [Linum tenue]